MTTENQSQLPDKRLEERKLHLELNEIVERYPLPWTHHVLMIKDADGRQVIHLGGLHDQYGRLYDGYYLAGLAALLTTAANASLLQQTTSERCEEMRWTPEQIACLKDFEREMK